MKCKSNTTMNNTPKITCSVMLWLKVIGVSRDPANVTNKAKCTYHRRRSPPVEALVCEGASFNCYLPFDVVSIVPTNR